MYPAGTSRRGEESCDAQLVSVRSCKGESKEVGSYASAVEKAQDKNTAVFHLHIFFSFSIINGEVYFSMSRFRESYIWRLFKRIVSLSVLPLFFSIFLPYKELFVEHKTNFKIRGNKSGLFNVY